MALFEIKFEINLFSLFSFVMGIFAGFILLGLIYLLSCLSSLRKKEIKINKEVSKISQEEIKRIIINYQNLYKENKKSNKSIPLDFFKNSIMKMMNEIASKFYPKSKRPLLELSINELILLDRYIISKIEELLSKRGLSLFRGLKVATLFKMVEAKNVMDNNPIIKTAKKYRVMKISDVLITALNFINPYIWFKKLIVNPSISLLLNKVFLVCYSLVGEETYKIYSKQVFISEDEAIKQLESLLKEEKKTTLLENAVEEIEIE